MSDDFFRAGQILKWFKLVFGLKDKNQNTRIPLIVILDVFAYDSRQIWV